MAKVLPKTIGSPPGRLAASDAAGGVGRLGLVTFAVACGEIAASALASRITALEESRIYVALAVACVVYGGIDFGRRWWADTRVREVRE